MQNTINIMDKTLADLNSKIANNALERQHLHDVTTMAAELKQLLVRFDSVLKEEGIATEVEQLENWLEAQRNGPVPACVVSGCGMGWLSGLRDKLKLSADEALRLEGEGGNPSSREQMEKTEAVLKVVRRIDRILNDSTQSKPH